MEEMQVQQPNVVHMTLTPDFRHRARRKPALIAGETQHIIYPDDEVTICGTGPSKSLCPPSKREDPVNGVQMFGVNRCYRFRRCDVGFAFDVLSGPTGLITRDRDRGSDIISEIGEAKIPFYYAGGGVSGLPGNMIPFPVQFLLRETGIVYYTSSIAYILAYLICMDVRKIGIYGVDMWCGNNYAEYNFEKPCLDFWAGVALGKGIQLNINWITSLTERSSQLHSLYGYNPDCERWLAWIPKYCEAILKSPSLDGFDAGQLVEAMNVYFAQPNPAFTKKPDVYKFPRIRIQEELKRRSGHVEHKEIVSVGGDAPDPAAAGADHKQGRGDSR